MLCSATRLERSSRTCLLPVCPGCICCVLPVSRPQSPLRVHPSKPAPTPQALAVPGAGSMSETRDIGDLHVDGDARFAGLASSSIPAASRSPVPTSQGRSAGHGEDEAGGKGTHCWLRSRSGRRHSQPGQRPGQCRVQGLWAVKKPGAGVVSSVPPWHNRLLSCL